MGLVGELRDHVAPLRTLRGVCLVSLLLLGCVGCGPRDPDLDGDGVIDPVEQKRSAIQEIDETKVFELSMIQPPGMMELAGVSSDDAGSLFAYERTGQVFDATIVLPDGRVWKRSLRQVSASVVDGVGDYINHLTLVLPSVPVDEAYAWLVKVQDYWGLGTKEIDEWYQRALRTKGGEENVRYQSVGGDEIVYSRMSVTMGLRDGDDHVTRRVYLSWDAESVGSSGIQIEQPAAS